MATNPMTEPNIDMTVSSTQEKMSSTGIDVNGIFRSIVSLAGKISLAQIAPLVMSFYIAGLIGSLGGIAFASYSLVMNINVTVFVTVMSGLQALYYVAGRELGKSQLTDYRHAIRAGWVIALLVGVLGVVVSMNIGPICAAFGVQADIVERVNDLGFIAAIGVLPTFLMVIYRVHAALMERAGLITVIFITGVVIAMSVAWWIAQNVSHDAEYATQLITLTVSGTHWLMLILAVITMLLLPSLKLPRDSNQWQLLKPPMKRLTGMGWQISAVVFMDNFVFLFAALMVGRFWPEYLPAHAAAALWVVVWLVLPLGISQAAVQKVSIFNGSGDKASRNTVAWISLVLGVIVAIPALICFWVFPVEMGRLLLGNTMAEGVNAVAIRELMPMAGIVVACQSIIVIAAAILRGIGQTKAPMIQAFIGYGVIAVGGQLLFALVLDQGINGLWHGLIAGFVVTTIAVVLYSAHELKVTPAEPLGAHA